MENSYHHGNLKHDLIETAIGVISEKGFEALRRQPQCGLPPF